jgi:hypothetical protein
MNESYQSAMFAPLAKPLELDADPTTEDWPMPEPRKWKPAPAPSLRDILRDLARRFRVWLVGIREQE